jgi:hypothetical protein
MVAIIQSHSSTQNVAVPSFHTKAKFYCLKMAKKVSECAQKVFSGAIGGAISIVSNVGIITLARKMNIISAAMGIVESTCPALSFEYLSNPTCPANVPPLVQDRLFFSPPIQCSLPAAANPTRLALITHLALSSINEENIFRNCMQNLLFLSLPYHILKRILPEKETLLQSKVYTIARVILTSGLFAVAHILSRAGLTKGFIQTKVVVTFVLGMICGIIKESKLGFLGACGAHFAHNVLVAAPFLLGLGEDNL